MRLPVLLALSLAASSLTRADGFDELTLSKLGDALRCVNLSVADLGWDKRPLDDAFRLSCVNETLDHPLALAERAERAEREFASDPAASALACAHWLDVTVAAPERGVVADAPLPRDLGAARQVAGLLIDARKRAGAAQQQALAGLSPDERKLVETLGTTLYTDESEEDRDLLPALAALRKVDLASLVRAELILADAAQRAREMLTGVDPSGWHSGIFDVGGVKVSIGGPPLRGLRGTFDVTILLGRSENPACFTYAPRPSTESSRCVACSRSPRAATTRGASVRHRSGRRRMGSSCAGPERISRTKCWL